MRENYKIILLEMISISEERRVTLKRFKDGMEKMGGFTNFITPINAILRWLNPKLIALKIGDSSDPYKLNLYVDGLDNSHFIKLMKELFFNCPELYEIFELEGSEITFRKNFTKDDIKEIREYVYENSNNKPGSVYIRKDN